MPLTSENAKRIVFDRTRFPMIWANNLGAYISYFPITKIQIEYFLCDRPEPRFDQKWYEVMLAANERISPTKLLDSNYHKVFATGIAPEDAASFADWLGNDLDVTLSLPTSDEWFDTFAEFEKQRPISAAELLTPEQPARIQTLITKMDAAVAKCKPADRKLTDSMLMRDGVMEWVSVNDDQWGGAGDPKPDLGFGLTNPLHRKPKIPATRNPAPAFYGFRLIQREL